MAEMDMRIETTESTRAKIAEKLGLNQPSVFDVVNRSRYATEEAYLDALVMEKMRREDPNYQAARRKLAAEYRDQQEQEQRTAQDSAYKQIRAAVQLDDLDRREIDAQAVELARRDLAAGRIPASELGSAIERYANQLSEKRKDTRAGNQLFNDMLRGKR